MSSGGDRPPVNIPINFVDGSNGGDIFENAKRKAEEFNRSVEEGLRSQDAGVRKQAETAHAEHIKQLERTRAERQSAWEAVKEEQKAREEATASAAENIKKLSTHTQSLAEAGKQFVGSLQQLAGGDVLGGINSAIDAGTNAWNAWKAAKEGAVGLGLGGSAAGGGGGGVILGGVEGLAASAASAAVSILALGTSAKLVYEYVTGQFGRPGSWNEAVSSSVAGGAQSLMRTAGENGGGLGSWAAKGAIGLGGGMLGGTFLGLPGMAYGIYQGLGLADDATGANATEDKLKKQADAYAEAQQRAKQATGEYEIEAAGNASLSKIQMGAAGTLAGFGSSSHTASAIASHAARYNMLRQQMAGTSQSLADLDNAGGEIGGADVHVQRNTLLGQQQKEQQEMLELEKQRVTLTRQLGEETLRAKEKEAQAAQHSLHLTEQKLDKEKSAYETAAEKLANMGEGGRSQVAAARERVLAGQGTLEDANLFKPFANGESEKQKVADLFEQFAQSGGGASILDPMKALMEETRKQKEKEVKAVEDYTQQLKDLAADNAKEMRSIEGEATKAIKEVVEQIGDTVRRLIDEAKDQLAEKFAQGIK